MKKQVYSNKNTTSKSVPTNGADQVLKAQKDYYFWRYFIPIQKIEQHCQESYL